jgi:Bacterial CdiA-CT RNAse A domain
VAGATPGPTPGGGSPDASPTAPRTGEPAPTREVGAGVEDWPEYAHLLGPEDAPTPAAAPDQQPAGQAAEQPPGQTPEQPPGQMPDDPDAPPAPPAPEDVIPGGALDLHEGRGLGGGGHTLSRHVGLSPDDLQARLDNEPAIPMASSYADEVEAEQAVARALDHHSQRIDDWLTGLQGRDPDILDRLDLRIIVNEDIGTVLLRGSDIVVPGRGVQVTLEFPPAGSPYRYYITRSYPIVRGF